MIKVIEVDGRGPALPDHNSCEACRRKLKLGDHVLMTQAFDEGFAKRGSFAHVDCVRELIERAPDRRESKFLSLRDQIFATGKAFPEC